MMYEVTVSSSRHTIKTPLEDLRVGDVIQISDEDKQEEHNVLAFNNFPQCRQDDHGQTITTYVDCSLCPLRGHKICQYHWEDENGVLHGLCESIASLADPNANDIRLQNLDDILANLG